MRGAIHDPDKEVSENPEVCSFLEVKSVKQENKEKQEKLTPKLVFLLCIPSKSPDILPQLNEFSFNWKPTVKNTKVVSKQLQPF